MAKRKSRKWPRWGSQLNDSVSQLPFAIPGFCEFHERLLIVYLRNYYIKNAHASIAVSLLERHVYIYQCICVVSCKHFFEH